MKRLVLAFALALALVGCGGGGAAPEGGEAAPAEPAATAEAAAEQDEGVAFSQQVGNNLRHGVVGVDSGLPQYDVAQIGDMCIAVGDCQLVEIAPYLVGSTAASGIELGSAILANTEQHEAVFRNLIARMIGEDARTQCNGERAGVVPQRVGLYR